MKNLVVDLLGLQNLDLKILEHESQLNQLPQTIRLVKGKLEEIEKKYAELEKILSAGSLGGEKKEVKEAERLDEISIAGVFSRDLFGLPIIYPQPSQRAIRKSSFARLALEHKAPITSGGK